MEEGNEKVLAQLKNCADKMQSLNTKLIVFGKKELYVKLTAQIEEIEKTIAEIKQEQTLSGNFIV